MQRFIKIDNTYYKETAIEQIIDKGNILVLKVKTGKKLEEIVVQGEHKLYLLSHLERTKTLISGFSSKKSDSIKP